MRTSIFIIILVVLTLPAMAQDQRDAVAQKALQSFKQLIAIQPNKSDEIITGDTALLAIGSPVATAIIPLDRLKVYKAGQPASGLIIDIDRVIYPIIDSRTKKSLVLLVLKKIKKDG